jgi:hypothetical protein
MLGSQDNALPEITQKKFLHTMRHAQGAESTRDFFLKFSVPAICTLKLPIKLSVRSMKFAAG